MTRFTEKVSEISQSWLKTLFYRFVRNSCADRWRHAVRYPLRWPREYGVRGWRAVLSTHQSHFDPVLIGLSFNGRMNYLARRSLFNNRILGTVIYLLDAIELDRDRSGIAGLKETLKRLKGGKKVLVFPEGTRTADGKIAPLKPGFLAVARRSKVPLVPIAITGAYEALPRTSKIPRRYPIHMAIGPKIEVDQVASMSDEEVLKELSDRMRCALSTGQFDAELEASLINRCALAPGSAAGTGANALRLIWTKHLA